jgi:hypothetical protein
MLIVYAAIKFLIFSLVVGSGIILMAAHSADEITRWKYWGAAVVMWAIIIALANLD